MGWGGFGLVLKVVENSLWGFKFKIGVGFFFGDGFGFEEYI